MAATCVQVAVPSDGTTTVSVLSNEPINASHVSIRNTGTVTVLLGATGSVLFPLLANEFWGIDTVPDDSLVAKVQTAGTAGQLTVLAV